jgi:hypothetical protein
MRHATGGSPLQFFFPLLVCLFTRVVVYSSMNKTRVIGLWDKTNICQRCFEAVVKKKKSVPIWELRDTCLLRPVTGNLDREDFFFRRPLFEELGNGRGLVTSRTVRSKNCLLWVQCVFTSGIRLIKKASMTTSGVLQRLRMEVRGCDSKLVGPIHMSSKFSKLIDLNHRIRLGASSSCDSRSPISVRRTESSTVATMPWGVRSRSCSARRETANVSLRSWKGCH